MNILLVDDDDDSRLSMAGFLRELGHRVVDSPEGPEALRMFANGEFQLVISDVMMPGMSGIELLQKIRSLPAGPEVDVMLVTGHGDVKTAIQALRAGAYDYLLKPVDVEELAQVVERVAEHQSLRRENDILTRQFEEAVEATIQETRQELTRVRQAYRRSVGLDNIGIFSGAMKKVIEQARKLHLDRSVPVLIQGETGTGKEVVARYIHYGDGQVLSPFVDLNCAAIAPGVFESELFGYEAGAFTGGLPRGQKGKLDMAREGTLFLDEIAEIPVNLQAKLLRFIQEREYYRVGGLKKIQADVRIMCATNVDIERRAEEGAFRHDLYYRLNVGRIYLPPLRERRDDILPLARMFLVRFSKEKKKSFRGIRKEAEDMLLTHRWPGNVRELENAMEWAVLMGEDQGEIGPSQLGILERGRPSSGQGKTSDDQVIDIDNFSLPPRGLSLEDFTNRIVQRALRMKNGNKTETAKYLGISRRSLYCRLDRLGRE